MRKVFECKIDDPYVPVELRKKPPEQLHLDNDNPIAAGASSQNEDSPPALVTQPDDVAQSGDICNSINNKKRKAVPVSPDKRSGTNTSFDDEQHSDECVIHRGSCAEACKKFNDNVGEQKHGNAVELIDLCDDDSSAGNSEVQSTISEKTKDDKPDSTVKGEPCTKSTKREYSNEQSAMDIKSRTRKRSRGSQQVGSSLVMLEQSAIDSKCPKKRANRTRAPKSCLEIIDLC